MSTINQTSNKYTPNSPFRAQTTLLEEEQYTQVQQAAKSALEFIPFLQQNIDLKTHVIPLLYLSGKFNEEEQKRFALIANAAETDSFLNGDFCLTKKDIDLLNKIKKEASEQFKNDFLNHMKYIETAYNDSQASSFPPIAVPVPLHSLPSDIVDEFVGSPSIRNGSISQNSNPATSCARSVDPESPILIQIWDALSQPSQNQYEIRYISSELKDELIELEEKKERGESLTEKESTCLNECYDIAANVMTFAVNVAPYAIFGDPDSDDYKHLATLYSKLPKDHPLFQKIESRLAESEL